VLRRHLEELERRIAQAQATKRLIEHALACEAEDFMACPHFQRLVRALDTSDCARDSCVCARGYAPEIRG